MIQHRHLDTNAWTLDAIDSVIERGDLDDWRELFHAARADRAIASKILRVAAAHDADGAFVLARELAVRLHAGLSN